MKEFVGREQELELLDTMYESSDSSLVILYGRRRIGKTRLLTHWMKRQVRQGIYWVAEPTSQLDQLRSFSQALYNYASPDDPAPLDFTYSNWDQAFSQLALMAKHEKLIVFIDELGYLADVNSAFAGTLQKAWDQRLSQSKVFLALSGSQMSLIQRMMHYDAPLHGRPTAQIKLKPLPFVDTKAYFPNYSAEDRVWVYATWGGVPAYWERLNQDASVLENMRQQLLPSNTLMQEEPRILLQDFINDPHNYVGIMRAIASGAHTSNRLSTRTGLSKGHISKYLGVLRETDFVDRAVPVTEDATKSRRGHYHINDPYLRFYYRFLSRFQARLALGEYDEILAQVAAEMPEFIEQTTWTDLCREWVLRASVHGRLPVALADVGGAWIRKTELPIVGVDQEAKVAVFANASWRDETGTLGQFDALLTDTDDITKSLPALSQWRIHYVAFANAGWSDEVRASAETLLKTRTTLKLWKTTGFDLVDLNEIEDDLATWHQESLRSFK